jgi:hypothetical protein
MASFICWRETRSPKSSKVECALVALAFLLAPALGAQSTSELRVRINASEGVPIGGALIALLDARDSVVAEGLSAESGVRALRAAPGSYRVRVRRVGFLPYVSGPVVLPRTDELALTVESPRVVLEGILVNSKSQCRRKDSSAEALGTVWDEIDKALRSSQLTTDDLAGMGTARTYRKEVASDGTVITADTTTFRIGNRRPFGAIDPAELAAKGYVEGDEQSGWSAYAPDETVLLSDQFAATHCFRLVRQPDRPRQIGVAFEPAPRRKLPEISGVLWVDEKTSELREVVFHFVNAKALSQFNAGGFTRFRRVASGAWLVDEWLLSLPKLGLRVGAAYGPRYYEIGRMDSGGGIVDAVRQER